MISVFFFIAFPLVCMHQEFTQKLQLLAPALQNLSASLTIKDPLEPLYALLYVPKNHLNTINMKFYANLLLTADFTKVNRSRLTTFAKEFPRLGKIGEIKSSELIFELIHQKPVYFKSILQAIELPYLITAIAIDPKTDTLIAVGDRYGNLYLIDSKNNKIITSIKISPRSLRSISFSPSEPLVAASNIDYSNNLTIIRYDISSEKLEPKTFTAHADAVTGITFNHAGTLLASTADDGLVKVWNTATWELKKTFKGHHGYGLTVSFNANDTLLASGCMDGTVKIWDVAQAILLTTLLKEGAVERTEFMRDYDTCTALFHPTKQDLLAVVLYDDNAIRLYDCNTKKYIQVIPLNAGLVNSLAFNPTGMLLAIRDSHERVRVIDMISFTRATLNGFDNDNVIFSTVCFNAKSELITSYKRGDTEGPGELLFLKKFNIPGNYPTALDMFITILATQK